ncbi:hypothetical protein LTR37_014587 [Vermiconidia calcicola]|uniref:Uncharacterized protein n=1 Tax=Vermiconidia calcicola TaxID=1690605 RepID=A0ACC3MT82_9PEZI|nr:hypothetical protein LTR37_014587 [Vermiconidia calcicola]
MSKSVYSTDHAERCGPGSITVDLAKRVPNGHVTGIETESDPLKEGQRLADHEGVKNVTFEVGDAHKLSYEDNKFDMVHAHQVLQHVGDPVKVLTEMRRVVKPGGIVACRESAVPAWYPESKGIEMADELFRRMSRDRGGNPHPGSHIHMWAQQAGFERSQITCTTGSWCFSSPDERAYWGGSNAARAESSGLAKTAVGKGYATADDLTKMVNAWHDFVRDDNAWYAILHGEIICRK